MRLRKTIIGGAALALLALSTGPAFASSTPSAGVTPDIPANSTFNLWNVATGGVGSGAVSFLNPDDGVQYLLPCGQLQCYITGLQPDPGTWQEYYTENDELQWSGYCLTLDDALQAIDLQPCQNLVSQLWRSNKVSNGGGSWEIWNEYQQISDPGYCAGDRSAVITGAEGYPLWLACPGGGSYYTNNQLWEL